MYVGSRRKALFGLIAIFEIQWGQKVFVEQHQCPQFFRIKHCAVVGCKKSNSFQYFWLFFSQYLAAKNLSKKCPKFFDLEFLKLSQSLFLLLSLQRSRWMLVEKIFGLLHSAHSHRIERIDLNTKHSFFFLENLQAV